MILFVKTKIKEDSVYCDLITIRIICFLYGGVFRGGIFRSPFPTWSDMTQNCNNKAFLKLCRFLNNLVSYLMESVCLAECYFGYNLIEGSSTEKN